MSLGWNRGFVDAEAVVPDSSDSPVALSHRCHAAQIRAALVAALDKEPPGKVLSAFELLSAEMSAALAPSGLGPGSSRWMASKEPRFIPTRWLSSARKRVVAGMAGFIGWRAMGRGMGQKVEAPRITFQQAPPPSGVECHDSPFWLVCVPPTNMGWRLGGLGLLFMPGFPAIQHRTACSRRAIRKNASGPCSSPSP